ncbi:EGF-like domain [Trinorchestia longiramus]|nr:EGF-like domain [Trinorchestia longiramus]
MSESARHCVNGRRAMKIELRRASFTYGGVVTWVSGLLEQMPETRACVTSSRGNVIGIPCLSVTSFPDESVTKLPTETVVDGVNVTACPYSSVICSSVEGVVSFEGSRVGVEVPVVTAIACEADKSCPSTQACVDNRCRYPCEDKPCGENAECVNSEHSAQCRCRNGFTGDALRGCTPVGCYGAKDCSDDEECYNGQCLSPCRDSSNPCPPTALCQPINHSASCLCPPGTTGLPFIGCSLTLTCETDAQCVANEFCLQSKCTNPCSNKLCALGAECQIVSRQPKCQCKLGFTGHPEKGCSKLECIRNEECGKQEICSSGVCRSACGKCGTGAKCVMTNSTFKCVCPSGTQGDPLLSCHAIFGFCSSDVECKLEQACVSGECRSPCSTVPPPCGISAQCTVINHRSICQCRDGWEGDPRRRCTQVQTPIGVCGRHEDCASDRECERSSGQCLDPCASNPCAASALCFTVNHQPVCNCPEGYSGNPLLECFIAVGCRSDSQCPPNEACINDQCRDPCACGVNAQCEVHQHRAMCKCPSGYRGDPMVFCQMPQNPCETSPCGEGALCELDEGNPICSCPKGMTGNPFNKCIPQGDECSDNQCGPNSGCRIIAGAVQCFCLPEFVGNPPYEHCKLPSDPCEPSPCGPNTDCNIINGYHRCTCKAGFIGSPNTIRGCDKPVNPCVPNPCGPGALCDPSVLNFCYCRPGLIGDPFSGCTEPEPECYPGACGINAECYKVNRELSCRCRSGYEGDPYTMCRAEPESPCDPSPCGSNSGCSVGNNNSPVCACQPGFFGDPLKPEGCKPQCDNDDDCVYDKSCINTRCRDPCPGACGINAHCDVVNHRPQCACPPGYTGNPYSECAVIVLDIPRDKVTTEAPSRNPCSPSPCAYNAHCSLEYNVAKCTCPPGYRGDPYSQCRPECLVNNECKDDQACSNQRCIDPCPKLCGVNAKCEVKNHIAVSVIALMT